MPTTLNRRSLLVGGLMLPAFSGCSVVGAFNTFVPQDGGSRLAVEGASYGPDPRQKLDIYVPETSARNLPVVVFVYGGSWNNGSRTEYSFVGRALAARGIVTAVVDYRLVPQVVYPDFIQDTAGATAWVRENVAQYGGDPRKLFIMGHSAGAYNAAMVALDPRYLAQAGVRGPALRGFIGLAGPYDFLPLDVSATQKAFGSWPRLSETQPVEIARRGAPPSFLATGSEDTTVYPRNTHKLAAVLRKLGTPVVEKTYEGLTHASILVAVSKPFRDKGPVLEDVIAFVQARSGA